MNENPDLVEATLVPAQEHDQGTQPHHGRPLDRMPGMRAHNRSGAANATKETKTKPLETARPTAAVGATMSDKSTDTQAEQVVMEALSKCGGGGINPEIYPVLWSKRHHNMWCLQCWPPHMKGRVSV